MTESKAIDRSAVFAEVTPGAANSVEGLIDERGGWVCEQHPELAFPHGDCAGPGVPAQPVTAQKPQDEAER